MHRPTTLQPGEISSGTLRTEDLLSAWADALRPLRLSKRGRLLVREADRLLGADELPEDAVEVLSELYDLAQEHAPPYCDAGSQEGDGALIGIWPCVDAVEEACQDGEILKVSDTSEVPAGHSGLVWHVNDHGNGTLYRASRGKLSELWSVV